MLKYVLNLFWSKFEVAISTFLDFLSPFRDCLLVPAPQNNGTLVLLLELNILALFVLFIPVALIVLTKTLVDGTPILKLVSLLLLLEQAHIVLVMNIPNVVIAEEETAHFALVCPPQSVLVFESPISKESIFFSNIDSEW